MTTSFGHDSHHQTNVSQKLKKAGAYNKIIVNLYGIQLTFMLIFIKGLKFINSC